MKSIILGLILIIVSSCSLTKLSSKQKSKKLTPKEEYYLGRSVAATVLASHPLVKSNFNRYLNTLGQYLAMYSKRPSTYKGYRFGLIKSKKQIAVSSPGGMILVSTGLIKKLRNEDQLAAVLAHEISHIGLYHAAEAIHQNQVNEVGTKLGMSLVTHLSKDKKVKKLLKNYDSVISEYSTKFLNGAYNKDQEVLADKYAMNILKRTGYDYRELVKVLGGLKSKGGGLLSNHPSDKKRVSKLKPILKSYGSYKRLAKKKSRSRRFKIEVRHI